MDIAARGEIALMKKTLLVFLLVAFGAGSAMAQIEDGRSADSLVFSLSDTSIHGYYIGDTMPSPLWQIGRTFKPFFTSDTNGVVSVMTDTTNSYPVNANNSMIIRVPNGINTIIGFWHRCQTDTLRDGGTVEFSADTGRTWRNVMGECNTDSSIGPGIRSENFYSLRDTLSGGVAAFSGSNSSRFSRLQFYWGALPKTTGSWGDCGLSEPVMLIRFRFISDTIPDTLAGWMIDSLKIERDWYPGGSVRSVSDNSNIRPYPNPSYTGKFNFPEIIDEEKYVLSIYDQMGRAVLTRPCAREVDLGFLPPDLYYFTVCGGARSYSGKLETRQ